MALGYHSIDACQEAISSHEFSEWIAYDQLEPIVPPWHIYFGTLTAAIMNTMRSKKSDKVWSYKDFYPDWQEHDISQTVDEQLAIVEMLNEAFGGEDKRQEKATTA